MKRIIFLLTWFSLGFSFEGRAKKEDLSPGSYCFTNTFMTVGLEGGGYAQQQEYHSHWSVAGAAVSNQKISNQGGALGVRFALDHRFSKNDDWVLGLAAAYRRYVNDTTGISSGTAPGYPFTYKSTFDNRYEFSLQSGWRLPRDVSVYLKAGAVVVREHFKVSDLTTQSNETHHPLGWVVGAAAYYPIRSGMLLGASVEYERYSRKGGQLWTATTPPQSVGSYKVTPSFVTFMVSLNFQWEFVVNALRPVE